MCWKLIAQQVQTAIWLKPENDLCRLQNAERNLLPVCEPEDDTVPSWRSPMRNCLELNIEQSNFQKLPPRPERLSVYSKSLEKIGWFLFMPCHFIPTVMNRGLKSVYYAMPIQGFIIIRDEESTVSTIRNLAPKFLWDVTSHVLENEEKKKELVLVCRKKFWAIV
ncbi:hypothetical protein B296_00050516 [Ensete ventricosum]|uniref:Methyltransferase n=1 Tax=Ensete ventricosum TaxID=4639 RepID=A0A426Y656_ENSVE|nr:hypothetical protein B296_00050516 [Ensete ventricosum]